MSKYKLVNDDRYGSWINKPNNMGDVGDLNDITDEMNRLLSERDEANEELSKKYVEYDQLFDAAEKIKIERDEAREKYDTLAVENMLEVNKLCKERDEARESLKHITEYGTEEINAAVELRQKLALALLERNEARDQLIHLRSCVYDVIHSLKAGAFDELEKAWKEGLK